MRPLLTSQATRAVQDGDLGEMLALVQLAASGDPGATRRFLDIIRKPLTRMVTGILGANHADLDDVIQKSLLAVLRALGAFRGECHPIGYASRIAMRTALHARKESAMRRGRVQSLAQAAPCDREIAWPIEDLANDRRKRALRDLLSELPREQAEALGLRVVLGWSIEEIAAAMGSPPNTIKSRIRLAKEALRERIEADPTLVEGLEIS
ncbi:MAG TPA: RNA polymerase sigma factor [Polyangiaceae bacterium]|nr:RNA polymerase sigma factor [Polyangiaceae bacterium]